MRKEREPGEIRERGFKGGHPKPGQRRRRVIKSLGYAISHPEEHVLCNNNSYPGSHKLQSVYYRCFLALARTLVSNTVLRIVVCAVWKGFNIVCAEIEHCTAHPEPSLTLTYNSHTSMKNCRIPSSFFPSCNNTNFMSAEQSGLLTEAYMFSHFRA
jgi:hypothetical protein